LQKRIAAISLFVLLSLWLIKAEIYVPITDVRDLRAGDQVILIIPSGNSSAAYAYVPTTTTNNVQRFYLQDTLRSPNPDLIWTVGGNAGAYTFKHDNITLGSATARWSATILTDHYFRLRTNLSTLSWISTTSSDYVDLGTQDLFNQMADASALRTGAMAWIIYKRVFEVHFVATPYGHPTFPTIIQKTAGTIALTGCSYSVRHPFLGWASEPGMSTANVGKEGDLVPVYSDTTFYAAFYEMETTDNCIDYGALQSPICTCYVGNFSRYNCQPYVYKGYDASVHQVMRDPNATDPMTQNNLKIVPPGAQTSIKLGDHYNTGNHNVQVVSYKIGVDTSDFSIIYINYAVVLHDFGHTQVDQPRFWVEFHDLDDNLLFKECGTLSFYAGDDSKWNICKYGEYFAIDWKDWTTLAVDVSAYHGKEIILYLHVRDCCYSWDFGYAYYTLECGPKQIRVASCNGKSGTTLTVNDGFYYRWYTKEGQYLGYDKSYTVPGNSLDTMYYCDLSTDKSFACYFTMSASIEPRFPVADFDYTLKRGVCADTLYVNNHSFASPDRVHPFTPNKKCDGARWNFGNGKTSDQYDLGPIIFDKPGDYDIKLETYLTDWNCSSDDTVQTIHVYAGDKYQVIPDTICQGDTFVFRNHHLTKTGVYVDTITKQDVPDLCFDSVIIEEHLFVRPAYLIEEYDSLCNNEQYAWHGRTIPAFGTYYDSLLTTKGCDSIHVLHLSFNDAPLYETFQYDSICQGNVFLWNGRPYHKTGVYTDTLTSMNGCDSVANLDLYVHPRYKVTHAPSDWLDPYFPVSKTDEDDRPAGQPDDWTDPYQSSDLIEKKDICPGESAYWPLTKHYYSSEGVFADTLYTEFGCDSVVYLKVTVHPDFDSLETQVIWEHETYFWRGGEYTVEGTYYDSLFTAYGCDSVYTLILHVNTDHELTLLDTICEGETYFVNDTIFYTKAGYYTDTLVSSQGLDSIQHLSLYVLPIVQASIDTTLCEGDAFSWGEYVWDELTPDDAGSDFHLTYSSLVTGCDSVLTLNLHVNPCTYGDTSVAICQKDLPFVWHGRTLSQSGTVLDTLKNHWKCDSILTLHFQVIEDVYRHLYDTICEGEKVFFYGEYLTTEGIHEKRLTSLVTGCDSVIAMHLCVHQTYRWDSIVRVCESNLPYKWRGASLYSSGCYLDTAYTLSHCDSILHLCLLVEKAFIDTMHVIRCDNNLPFLWREKEYSTSGYYEERYASTSGCDSLYSLRLSIYPTYDSLCRDTICYGSSYHWRESAIQPETYKVPGEYVQTNKFSSCHQCDSIFSIRLMVHPSYQKEDSSIMCQGETFMWHGTPYYDTGVYSDTLHSVHGCDSISTLYLNVHSRFDPKLLKAPERSPAVKRKE